MLITRRDFTQQLLAYLSMPAALSTVSCRKEQPKKDLSYLVLEASRDEFGKKLLLKINNEFYEVGEDEGHRYKNLKGLKLVDRLRLESENPHPLYGYQWRTKHGIGPDNPMYQFALNAYQSEISKGINFKDYLPLKPKVELAEKEYRKKHSIGQLQFVSRKVGDGFMVRGDVMRIKHAAGLDPKQHMTFLTSAAEISLPVFYEENTNRLWEEKTSEHVYANPNYPKDKKKETLEAKWKDTVSRLPEILRVLNISGTIVVPLEDLPNNQIPENYKTAFPNLHVVGDNYKVAVFDR